MGYQRWYLEHMFVVAPAVGYVAQWLQSFKEFPPRQKPGSFNPGPGDGSGDEQRRQAVTGLQAAPVVRQVRSLC